MRDELSVIRRALRESKCAPPAPLLAATVAFVASAFAAKLRGFMARRREARTDRWIADELAAVEAAFAAEARAETAEKPTASAAERRREGRRRRTEDGAPPVSVSPHVSTIHEEEIWNRITTKRGARHHSAQSDWRPSTMMSPGDETSRT